MDFDPAVLGHQHRLPQVYKKRPLLVLRTTQTSQNNSSSSLAGSCPNTKIIYMYSTPFSKTAIGNMSDLNSQINFPSEEHIFDLINFRQDSLPSSTEERSAPTSNNTVEVPTFAPSQSEQKEEGEEEDESASPPKKRKKVENRSTWACDSCKVRVL